MSNPGFRTGMQFFLGTILPTLAHAPPACPCYQAPGLPPPSSLDVLRGLHDCVCSLNAKFDRHETPLGDTGYRGVTSARKYYVQKDVKWVTTAQHYMYRSAELRHLNAMEFSQLYDVKARPKTDRPKTTRPVKSVQARRARAAHAAHAAIMRVQHQTRIVFSSTVADPSQLYDSRTRGSMLAT